MPGTGRNRRLEKGQDVPGHKTDKKDSAWICKLLRAGLLKGSFVPPKEQREPRDLTLTAVSWYRMWQPSINKINRLDLKKLMPTAIKAPMTEAPN